MVELATKNFHKFYNINYNESKAEETNVNTGDIQEYIDDLIDKSLENKTKKAYKFESGSVAVYSLLNNIFQNDFNIDTIDNNNHQIAKRLAIKEKLTQEKYGHLNDVKKGSLIISLQENTSSYRILIAKVDQRPYLDSEVFQKQMGLPFEERVLKTCVLEVFNNDDDKNMNVLDIHIADSNSKISTYWVKDFLELVELNTNEKNTRDAVKSFDSVLGRQLKNKAPSDHNLLRNQLVGYFKTQSDFKLDDMINHVFGDYKPKSKDINIDNVKGKMREVPEKFGIDTHFTIVKSEVKLNRVIKISEKIDLTLKDHIERLQHVIFSREENGEKLICIKTDDDEVFKKFKYKEE